MFNRSLTLKCKQIYRHCRIQLQPKIDQLGARIAKAQGANSAVTAQRLSSNEQARKQNKRRVHKCAA
jgi:hypothetical protein